MKLISWNVNGLRAVLGHGFLSFFTQEDADFFCIQETKMQEGQAEFVTPGYTQIWNSAEKKGYSGTLTLAKRRPKSIVFGADGKHTDEGRLITCEYERFFLVNCYSPNAQPLLKRIDYRLAFEADLRAWLCKLDREKPVVLCGDLNVAHEEIDLARPKENVGNPGFSDAERKAFSALCAAGFADGFRALYPEARGAYSWWSFRARAREKNIGWRIDYFVVSRRMVDKLKDVRMAAQIEGSDHCPVILEGDF